MRLVGSHLAMSAVVASPPTSGWQALASTFASDSATLILRLVVLFIGITIAGCGLRLNMRNSSSVSALASTRIRPTTPSEYGTGEHPQEGIEMNNLHSAGNSILPATTGGPSVTCDGSASTSSEANTVLLDVATIALNASETSSCNLLRA
ncbi:unnamed protein product [Sphagnum troendelagicum]|uniref:Uncharacterized protein n=1 Tax=Sphagnum troendelagicum TaxID=128251 RepID=A0ABP0TMV5_9BRYO